jgi:hypothetical protein
MVGQNPPLPGAYPFFRLTTALATLLFVFSFGLNSVSRMAAPATGGFGGGGDTTSQESSELYAEGIPAATEAPAAAAPAEPPLQMLPAPTTTAALEDTFRAIETPTLEAPALGNAVEQKQVERQSQPLVPFGWQIGLGVVAILSVLLMLLMRLVATRRWR